MILAAAQGTRRDERNFDDDRRAFDNDGGRGDNDGRRGDNDGRGAGKVAVPAVEAPRIVDTLDGARAEAGRGARPGAAVAADGAARRPPQQRIETAKVAKI